jgi:ATP-binding cassette subfamily B protein
MSETLAFDRVLVIENGRLAEDGSPAALAGQSGSRYASLLAAERSVRDELWSGKIWRRHWLEGGKLVEHSFEGTPS